MSDIIQNALKITIGKTVAYIRSEHEHDFQSFQLPDGSMVAVDGGLEYLRRVGASTSSNSAYSVEDFSVSKHHTFNTIKARLLWGTYGIYGSQPKKLVRLRDCSSRHLQEIRKCRPGNKGDIYDKVILSILRDRRSRRNK